MNKMFSRFAGCGADMDSILAVRRSFFGAQLVSSDDSYWLCWVRNRQSFKMVFNADGKIIGYWGVIPVSRQTHDLLLQDRTTHGEILSLHALPWGMQREAVCLYIIGAVTLDRGNRNDVGTSLRAGKVALDLGRFLSIAARLHGERLHAIFGYPSRRFGRNLLVRAGLPGTGSYAAGDRSQEIFSASGDALGKVVNDLECAMNKRRVAAAPQWDPQDEARFMTHFATGAADA